jgi:hypothetical protein
MAIQLTVSSRNPSVRVSVVPPLLPPSRAMRTRGTSVGGNDRLWLIADVGKVSFPAPPWGYGSSATTWF